MFVWVRTINPAYHHNRSLYNLRLSLSCGGGGSKMSAVKIWLEEIKNMKESTAFHHSWGMIIGSRTGAVFKILKKIGAQKY